MDPVPLSSLTYILIIILLLLGGAYFAACETSFASVNEIRLISYADDGNKKAKKALKIKENFDLALSSILIGNNIMHIATSSVATLFVSKLGGNELVTVSTFITAFVVFALAEMLPKAYASDCNEKVALALAPSLYIIITILKPITIVFKAISNLISKLFGIKEEDDITVTEEELFDIIENIDEKDKILEDEAELVKSALDFTVKTAKDILVPLNKITKIDESLSKEELDNLIIDGEYTRLPVFKDNKPIGILQIRKYLKNKLNNKNKLYTKADLDKIVYVKDNKPIDELLDYLSVNKTHMAFVRDNNKNILGMLTVEDILEELVGEIYDEEEKERVKL